MDMLILKQTQGKRLKHQLVEKLDEEAVEVYHAVASESLERQAEEALDVIQVCIALLDKLEQEGVNIPKQVKKHTHKLLERGWEYKNVLYIDLVHKEPR